MNLREQRSLAQLALAMQFALGPLIVYFGSATSRWEAALDVGLLLGQVNLAAILFAWSGRSLSARISATLFWLVYVWCWLMAHLRNDRVLGAGNEYVPWTLLVTLQCAALVLCLWRGRRRGLRLRTGSGAVVGSAAERQFGIRQLFLWTAAVAVLLGVSRFLDILDKNQWPDVGFAVHLSVLRLIALIAMGHALAGLGACWAVYTRLPLLVRAPGALAFVVLATLLQTALYQKIHPHPGFHWAWWLVHNLANFSVVAATLAVLRWCGYKLTAQAASPGGAGPEQPTALRGEQD